MSSNIYDYASNSLKKTAGFNVYADTPIGAIVPFGGTNVPTGFLLCNGSEVLKTDYAELYAVIGDAFGTASVNTKFVLPDLREATTKGVGLTGLSNNHYDNDGVALGEFIDDRVQTHTHDLLIASSSSAGSTNSVQISNKGEGTHGSYIMSSVMSGRSGATTEVKAVGVNYIIKAKQVALPADLEAQVEEAVEEKLSWTLLVDLPRATSSATTNVPIPNNIKELMIEIYSIDSDDKLNLWETYYTRTVKASEHDVYLQFYANDSNNNFRRQGNIAMTVGGTSYAIWLDTQGADSIRIYYR